MEWVPYFGNQKQHADFFTDMISNLVKDKIVPTFYETNAGSHAISLGMANKDWVVHSNDISAYSRLLGQVLHGTCASFFDPKDECWPENLPQDVRGFIQDLRERNLILDLAASCAALVSLGGYTLDWSSMTYPEFLKEYKRWHKVLLFHRVFTPGSISQSHCHDFLEKHSGDVVFMDFAWPWKEDGRETEEYTVMVDQLSSMVIGKKQVYPRLDHTNIKEFVQKSMSLALKNFNYVILSNQSSNCPQDSVLQNWLKEWGMAWDTKHTITKPAVFLDNLLKDEFFVEYTYIFKGKL